MCRFNFRLLIAFLTFGISVMGVSLWLIKFPVSEIPLPVLETPLTETNKVKEREPEIRGFDEVVTARDGTYVTVQGWIDPKYICQGELDSEHSTCTTALVGSSPAKESMYIRLQLCNEVIKYSCIVHDPNQPYYKAKIYDYNSNLINIEHQVKITGGIEVVDGKGQFRSEIGRIENIDGSQTKLIPLSKIDLSKIGHINPNSRAQDVDYNQLPVIEQLLVYDKESIPFLISKLTDETRIKGHQVMDFWNGVKVGDVAFFILTDFFTDNSLLNPTIDGASFNTFLGCNDRNVASDTCYYNYIEKYGRKNIKTKWQKIWNENKDKIFWDESERCFRIK